MTIDYEKIKAAFPNKAWAYAEGFDSVKIGKWDGSRGNSGEFFFAEPLEAEYLTELRVFDSARELKFTGNECRDTADYNVKDYIKELADAQYFMYGEKPEVNGDFTSLSEERGGAILFPAKLTFPNGKVGLKLGIRNYVRYNKVMILPKGEDYDCGLNKSGTGALEVSGAGALEVVDYAYAGFFYANGKAVEL